MVVVPVPTGVTTPLARIVATEVLPLIQSFAGVVASYKVVVLPRHTVVLPVIAAGEVPTVTTMPLVQPAPLVNTTVAVPAETPVKIPLFISTVQIAVLLLLQVPEEELFKVLLVPIHTDVLPVIEPTVELTVTCTDWAQPFALV